MKRSLRIISFLFFTVVITIITACNRKGDVGPKGDTGANGPAGPTGPKGETGTSNVIYSDWIDVTYQKDDIGYYATLVVPKITIETLSSADIRVYANFNTSTSPRISSIPFIDTDETYIDFIAYLESIELFSNKDLSTYTDQSSGRKINQYRYIIIPGGIAAKKNGSINWSNYNEVKTFLGLKD